MTRTITDCVSRTTMMLSLLWLLLGISTVSHAFVVTTSSLSSSLTRGEDSLLLLFAKTAAKKNKKNKKIKQKNKTKSSGGGFGVVSTPTKKASNVAAVVNVDPDFAQFPPLEDHVLQTRVPAPAVLYQEPGVLTEEVYDRLDQIYGLPHFYGRNEQQQQQAPAEAKAESTSSIMDLLTTTEPTASSTSSTTTTTTTSDSSLDLDALLASATGGTATTSLLSPNDSKNLKNDDDDDTAAAAAAAAAARHAASILSGLSLGHEFRVLHMDPLVLAVDNFLSPQECDQLVQQSLQVSTLQNPSPTVGRDTAARSQRTSTTFYHHFRDVPAFMARASRLLGTCLGDNNSKFFLERWEEPQTVRYRRNEQFTWHWDALGPDAVVQEPGGQRIATLLVYLTDLGGDSSSGGATVFRDLLDIHGHRLTVSPRRGTALLFFPTAGGVPGSPVDVRTLHCGQMVSNAALQDKWIAQLWLRQYDSLTSSSGQAYTPTAPPGNHPRDPQAYHAMHEYAVVAQQEQQQQE